MSKKNILLAITNGLWLMDVHSAEQLGHNVASILSGKEFWNEKHKANPEFLIAEPTGSYFSDSLNAAKPGSVAIISISGPIMKYDNCGDPGSKTFEDLVKQADANPNITGIIFQIDSGGGEVHGTQSLANVIKSVSKPTVTVAEDLMASAAYWLGSSTDYIFANTGTTRIGSIGTMISFSDMQPVWEAMGAKFHLVNATASTEKNKDIADARKGNYDALIKNTLDPLNNEFMSAVKANRGDKLNADMTLKGQVYTANDALKYGLIDAVGNVQDAIVKINELASGVETPTQTHKTENQINMKKITLLASHAALLALCGVSISAGETSVEIDADDLLTKVNAALATSAEVKTSLDAATEKLTVAEKKASDAEAKATESVNALTTAEAKIRSLETAGSTNAATTAATEKTEVEEKVESFKTTADDDLARVKANLGIA